MQEKSKYIQNAVDKLSELTEVSDELYKRLTQDIRLVKQPKMSLLEFEGDDCQGSLWYLVQGVACSIQYDTYLEKEQAILLWKKGDILFQPESFFEKKVLQESICLWDDSILLGISYLRLKQLLDDFPLLSSILIRSYGLRIRRFATHGIALSYPAIERVAYLLRSYPGIHNKVKQELLAQYLHIDRRTFNICLKEFK